VAVLGSAFNTGYRRAIDGHLGGVSTAIAKQAREAPAIAIQLARRSASGSALLSSARDAFAVGMRDAVLLGMGMLVVGAIFVWVRGASRAEEIVEDELDVEFATEQVA
jgi:hypothetical protein